MLRAAVAAIVTAVALAVVALGGTTATADQQTGPALATTASTGSATTNGEPTWG